MPTLEQFLEMPFPVSGVDLSMAFDRQRPRTTPAGKNVRAYEPATLRARGGSRSGLSRYLPQLPNGSHPIQHLNVIVDPTVDALLDQFDSPDADAVDDPSSDDALGAATGIPRNPGRKVRNGGSGRQPNRNKRGSTPLVQQFASSTEASQAAWSGTFTSAVAANNLLVVLALTQNDTSAGAGTGQTVTISDSLGQSWLQAGGYARVVVSGSSPSREYALSAWYAVTTVSGAETVTMTPSSKAYVDLCLYEFKGMKSSAGAAFDAVSTGSAQGVIGSAMTCGSVSVAIAGDLVVAAILQTHANGRFSGFKALASDSAIGFDSAILYAGYKSPVNSSTTPSINAGGVATDYCAIGLSFKKK